jgi:periplasmic divalent cation tolerance protein
MSEAEASAAVRLVLSTAPDRDTAHALARRLVEERLAACVNVVPGIASVYRWQGAVEEADEVLLVVKTTERALPALERALGQHHPYDTPECVAPTPAHVEHRYRAWLAAQCDGA